MATCKGCGIEIEWQQRDNKYVPIEPTTEYCELYAEGSPDCDDCDQYEGDD